MPKQYFVVHDKALANAQEQSPRKLFVFYQQVTLINLGKPNRGDISVFHYYKNSNPIVNGADFFDIFIMLLLCIILMVLSFISFKYKDLV